MSDGWDDYLDQLIDDEAEMPELDTEEGRDRWAEILMEQDPPGSDVAWIHFLPITDGENMVARIKFEDGSEEIVDLIIRRSIAVTHPEGQRN